MNLFSPYDSDDLGELREHLNTLLEIVDCLQGIVSNNQQMQAILRRLNSEKTERIALLGEQLRLLREQNKLLKDEISWYEQASSLEHYNSVQRLN